MMREITFEIPGNPSLTIHAVEQEDGTILFDLSVSGDGITDLRGLYFNLADDSLVNGLSATGADLTDQDYGNVSNFKNGNNVNGSGHSPYDVGLDFGTPGVGQGVVSSTSFVLSGTSGEPLTLDIISQMEFGARLQSVDQPGGKGKGGNSQKISVIAPAAPDAIDDTADTSEDTPVILDVVANDTDADGDSLTVIEVGAAENGTVEIVDNQILYTSNENWSGTDSFTYKIFDGAGGYDSANATINVEAVADAPDLSLNARVGASVNEVIVDISSALVDTDGSESYILSFSDLPDGVVIQGAIDGQILAPTGDESITLVMGGSDKGTDFDFDFSVSATSTEDLNNDTAISTETIDVVFNQAGAPDLSLDVKAGDSVNEVIVDISSALVDTDGSESYILSFSDLPDGVVMQGAIDGQILAPTGDDRITLVLGEGRDFDFDFSVSATSTEVSNSDMATSTETIDVVFDHNETTNKVTFEAVNQSIWTSGDEFVFTDNRFLGIDTGYHSYDDDSGWIQGRWSYDVKAGFQSNLTFEGGDIDAEIPWQLDFETNFNRTTDVLTLDTAATLLNGGSFQTDGPSLDYMLDFIFNYDLYANIDLIVGLVWPIPDINADLFYFNEDHDYSINLVDYDSDTSDGLAFDFPYGITATLEWPNLEVSGSETSLGIYSGDGASNNALDINLDIDQALADIFLGGANPLNPPSVNLGVVGGNLDMLDVDVNAGMNFLQDFLLQAGNLAASLIFEDGSVVDFTFGDELIFASASDHDADHDGEVKFEVAMDLVGSTLNNDTDLGFNVGYNFDMVKASWWYDIEVASDSGTFGPFVNLGGSLPVASIDVFEDTVEVDFGVETIYSFA